IGSFTFEQPDMVRYPCLQLAIDASRAGQAATTALNAANEVSVDAFLREKIRFVDIAALNQDVLSSLSCREPQSIAEVLDIDRQAREVATRLSANFLI
ncbi:MAG: 1-deoxy-D-xylulose-5-phosphate reductoisomerase, partial [Enterobacterales bacterium]|nr:1-deoxy-D-xylulose-5-phosphate reductoisomerase [Enterobacterales bacterium]